MPTKTVANILDMMSKDLHDYHHSTVTTALAASVSLIDTGLANVYGGGTNDFFNNRWAKITSLANSGVVRLIADYVGSTTTATLQGANLTSDVAALATYEFHRYNPTEKLNALNIAARRIFPTLHKPLHDLTLITGNLLPNSHFEDWIASTSYPDLYSVTNVTAAKTTTAGVHRGGVASAKLTASADNGYMYITSNDYPRLLDLKGQTVDLYAWAYPEVANDAYVVIYTLQADGTAQTLTSTTTCPAGAWTRIELTNQTLNSDLVKVEIRFKVATNTKYVYFDDARLIGKTVRDYYLPASFATGSVDWVGVQAESCAAETDDFPCDDIGNDVPYNEIWGCRVISDGKYRFLRTPLLSASRRFELKGIGLLDHDSTADTDVIVIDDPQADLLSVSASIELLDIIKSPTSPETSAWYEKEIARLTMKKFDLQRNSMTRPPQMLRFR